MDILGKAIEPYYIIAMAEASTNLAKYTGFKYGYQYGEYNKRYNEFFTEARANFGAEAKRRLILGTFIRGESVKDKYYTKALMIRRMIINEMSKVLKDGFILSPTLPILTAEDRGHREAQPGAELRHGHIHHTAQRWRIPAHLVPIRVRRRDAAGRAAGDRAGERLRAAGLRGRMGKVVHVQIQTQPGRSMKIGLEVHVALPTKSKLFCSCSTEEERPNAAICPICMGSPGSKPMLNEEAVRSALGIASALHCKINNRMSFVRKVYFYPDLPKSYQITQLDGSVGGSGVPADRRGQG